MVSSIGSASSLIGNYYNLSQNKLADTLTKLSSGKNYSRPKDGVAEYFAVDTLKRNRRGYEIVRRDLERGLAIVNMAEGFAMELVEGFKQLKVLTEEYWGEPVGSDTRTAIESEFNAIVTGMQTTIDNAAFDGYNLFQAGTLTSIMLDPNDISKTFDITYAAGDIVNTGGLAVDAGVDYDATIAIIDAEYNKSMTYLAKTSGYIHSFHAQISVTDSIIENTSVSEASINDVDEAKAIKDMITQEIRQQASVSMMAHASMMRMNMLKLIDWQ
jgi:flagellin